MSIDTAVILPGFERLLYSAGLNCSVMGSFLVHQTVSKSTESVGCGGDRSFLSLGPMCCFLGALRLLSIR